MMDGTMDMVSGLEKIRGRFLDLLKTRQQNIAHHAVLAYDSTSMAEVNVNLSAARDILHQIAGTAGSLGFEDLGNSARHCENEIVTHLNTPNDAMTHCPHTLLVQLDDFVGQCRSITC